MLSTTRTLGTLDLPGGANRARVVWSVESSSRIARTEQVVHAGPTAWGLIVMVVEEVRSQNWCNLQKTNTWQLGPPRTGPEYACQCRRTAWHSDRKYPADQTWNTSTYGNLSCWHLTQTRQRHSNSPCKLSPIYNLCRPSSRPSWNPDRGRGQTTFLLYLVK